MSSAEHHTIGAIGLMHGIIVSCLLRSICILLSMLALVGYQSICFLQCTVSFAKNDIVFCLLWPSRWICSRRQVRAMASMKFYLLLFLVQLYFRFLRLSPWSLSVLLVRNLEHMIMKSQTKYCRSHHCVQLYCL